MSVDPALSRQPQRISTVAEFSFCTGVENASRQFFRKDSDALNTQETALLAGLLRAPDSSPYKHPEKALQRRNQVLEAMVVQGKLSASDAARAEATPVITQ
jgi:membrane peptidoglycan carboxypeptidase